MTEKQSQTAGTFAAARKLSRRTVLASSMGAVAGLGSLALVGCGDDDDKPSATGGTSSVQSPAASASAAAKQPKRGGTLVVDSGEPSPAALVYTFNQTNYYLRYGVWDGLITQGTDNRPRLMLAETFEMKPDFTSVHIKLRPGLTFHDGRPLTADDVKFSIESFRADSTTSQLKNPGKLISDIKIADPLTLDITFSAPRPEMEDYFAFLPIIDEKTVDQAPQMKTLNGAGPFKFVSYTPNQGYVMERNPNYWDQGKPYLDKIQGRIYADEQARILAMQSGELMHANQVSPAFVKAMKGNANAKVVDGGISGSWYAGLVVDFPALKDVRVRQALNMAVDRKRIADEWGEGAFKPQMLPWPDSSPAFIPEDEALLKYDPEQAKSLLKQAGADGFDFPMDIGQGREALAQYVQDDWKAIGVNAKINVSEYAAYLARFQARKVTTTFLAPFGFSDAMSPNTFFDFTQPVRIPNQSHYEPASYKAMLEKLVAVDPRSPAGKDLLHQWNKLYLVDDPWIVPLAPNHKFYAMRKNVMALPDGARDAPTLSEYWIDA
jgi:peptide/nickel transport system substrate-binding protein